MKCGLILWAGLGMTAVAGAAVPWVGLICGGELGGELRVVGEGLPVVVWRAEVTRERDWRVVAEDAGVTLRVRVAGVLASDGGATWRVEEASATVATWLPWARAKGWLGEVEFTAGGRVVMGGAGTWAAGAARPRGEVWAEWREAEIDMPSNAMRLVEVEARVVGEVAAGRWTLERATAGCAGGRITVLPMMIEQAAGRVEATVRVEAVDLAQLRAWWPEALQELQGMVSGEVSVGWSVKDGWALRGGRLALTSGSSGRLRLAAAPGMITGQVPEDSPARAALQRVELGETPLVVTVLELVLAPPNDPLGRSAVLRVEGEPIDPGLKAPVILEVNVRGPLEALIRLGMDERWR